MILSGTELYSGIELIIIDKVEGFLLGDTVHVGHLVPELDPVELVSVFKQLRPEEQNMYFCVVFVVWLE